jgi:hypothetical protein
MEFKKNENHTLSTNRIRYKTQYTFGFIWDLTEFTSRAFVISKSLLPKSVSSQSELLL